MDGELQNNKELNNLMSKTIKAYGVIIIDRVEIEESTSIDFLTNPI